MGTRKRDLTGQVFGRLTVLEEVGKTASGNFVWLCQCSCGLSSRVASTKLVEGRTTSCGCKKWDITDRTGQTRGSKTLIGRVGKKRSNGSAHYKCVCVRCGRESVSDWDCTKKRCVCFTTSVYEQRIYTFVQAHFSDCVWNAQDVLPPTGLEFDAWIPSLRAAVEYQDHNHAWRAHVIKNDKRKAQLCQERGIALLVIWWQDFKKSPEAVYRKILTFLRARSSDLASHGGVGEETE